MQHGALGRFFGGPPLAVAVRLILLSILVGVILAALGLDPLNICAASNGCSGRSGRWAGTRFVGVALFPPRRRHRGADLADRAAGEIRIAAAATTGSAGSAIVHDV